MRLHFANFLRDARLKRTNFVSAPGTLLFRGIAKTFFVWVLGILYVQVLQIVNSNVHIVIGRLDATLAFLANLNSLEKQTVRYFCKLGQVSHLPPKIFDPRMSPFVNIIKLPFRGSRLFA